MRTLIAVLLCVALGMVSTSESWAIGHHNGVQKKAEKDVKKAKKKAAKAQRPKLLHHHK